ncbi:MAG: FHA domain-containing protein, partial [Myxococcaceae bacterium]
MSQPAVLQVVILRDGLLVGTEVFVPGSYALGSAPEADLKLEDPTVSGQHAVLYFQNNRAAIQDAGSLTGLYVNGHKVSACEIRAVDEVLIGPFVLKVRVLEKKPQTQKPAPAPELASLLKGSAASTPPKASPGPGRSGAPSATPSGMANTVPTSAPIPQSARAPMDSTVASARRLQAVPQSAVATPSPNAQRAPHLRPVPTPLEEDRPTESVVVPDSLFDVNTVPGVQPKNNAPTRAMKPQDFAALDAEVTDPRPNLPAARAKKTSLKDIHFGSNGAPKLSSDQLASKRAPKLYLELYWGETRRESRSFNLDKKGRPVTAAQDELAQMPLWGFTLPDGEVTLAEPAGQSFRVFVPPYAVVERAKSGESFMPSEAEGRGQGKFVTLSVGQAARFSEGEMSLVAYVAPPPEKVFVNPLKGLPWLAIFFFVIFAGAWVSFLIWGPGPAELPDFQNKTLPPVAVRLL